MHISYQLFRIRTSNARFANQSLFWFKRVWKRLEMVCDSVWFIRTVHSRTESFAVVSQTGTVTRYFISMETKRVLDEVDIYLQSVVGNKKKQNLFLINNKSSVYRMISLWTDLEDLQVFEKQKMHSFKFSYTYIYTHPHITEWFAWCSTKRTK